MREGVPKVSAGRLEKLQLENMDTAFFGNHKALVYPITPTPVEQEVLIVRAKTQGEDTLLPLLDPSQSPTITKRSVRKLS